MMAIWAPGIKRLRAFNLVLLLFVCLFVFLFSSFQGQIYFFSLHQVLK